MSQCKSISVDELRPLLISACDYVIEKYGMAITSMASILSHTCCPASALVVQDFDQKNKSKYFEIHYPKVSKNGKNCFDVHDVINIDSQDLQFFIAGFDQGHDTSFTVLDDNSFYCLGKEIAAKYKTTLNKKQ